MSDAQLVVMWAHLGSSIGLLNAWLNSKALWETVFGTLGFLIFASWITTLIFRAGSSVGIYPR